jgi:hypothetical protein
MIFCLVIYGMIFCLVKNNGTKVRVFFFPGNNFRTIYSHYKSFSLFFIFTF